MRKQLPQHVRDSVLLRYTPGEMNYSFTEVDERTIPVDTVDIGEWIATYVPCLLQGTGDSNYLPQSQAALDLVGEQLPRFLKLQKYTVAGRDCIRTLEAARELAYQSRQAQGYLPANAPEIDAAFSLAIKVCHVLYFG